MLVGARVGCAALPEEAVKVGVAEKAMVGVVMKEKSGVGVKVAAGIAVGDGVLVTTQATAGTGCVATGTKALSSAKTAGSAAYIATSSTPARLRMGADKVAVRNDEIWLALSWSLKATPAMAVEAAFIW